MFSGRPASTSRRLQRVTALAIAAAALVLPACGLVLREPTVYTAATTTPVRPRVVTGAAARSTTTTAPVDTTALGGIPTPTQPSIVNRDPTIIPEGIDPARLSEYCRAVFRGVQAGTAIDHLSQSMDSTFRSGGGQMLVDGLVAQLRVLGSRSDDLSKFPQSGSTELFNRLRQSTRATADAMERDPSQANVEAQFDAFINSSGAGILAFVDRARTQCG